MRFKLPHTFVLLFALVVAAAALTWIVPAGQYERREEDGRRLVDPGTFHLVAQHPAGLREVLLAWPRGLEATAAIVFYLFIIGGAFGVIQATGALEAGIGALVRRAGGRGEAVIPLLVVLFSLAGGTIGLAEEALAILPALVVLVRRLGYDDLLAGIIGLAGAAAGFSGAFVNPFTVGVGQAIVGLPLFSGIRFRLVVWAAVTLVTTLWIAHAARRLKLAAGDRPLASASRPSEQGDDFSGGRDDAAMSRAQRGVLIALFAAVVLLVIGALRWNWGLLELSGLFIATAIVAGAAGRLGADRTADSFVTGAAGFAGAALVVGLARGVLVIFDGAHVTDTILHSLVDLVRELPAALTVVGIYAVQIL